MAATLQRLSNTGKKSFLVNLISKKNIEGFLLKWGDCFQSHSTGPLSQRFAKAGSWYWRASGLRFWSYHHQGITYTSTCFPAQCENQGLISYKKWDPRLRHAGRGRKGGRRRAGKKARQKELQNQAELSEAHNGSEGKNKRKKRRKRGREWGLKKTRNKTKWEESIPADPFRLWPYYNYSAQWVWVDPEGPGLGRAPVLWPISLPAVPLPRPLLITSGHLLHACFSPWDYFPRKWEHRSFFYLTALKKPA